MVRRQIERRGVRNPRVLAAMETVPREAFVPPAIRHRAFDDGALAIDFGQTISQPYVVAHMVEALELEPEARVLEIGTGSGYAAAVLAEIAEVVYTIERIEALAESARARLARLGYENVQVKCGDGSLGWTEHVPYDGILVSAGAPAVPPSLRSQLAVGGRLVIPIGASHYDQVLVCVRCTGPDEYAERRLSAVRFVPLVGAEGWEGDDGRGRFSRLF